MTKTDESLKDLKKIYSDFVDLFNYVASYLASQPSHLDVDNAPPKEKFRKFLERFEDAQHLSDLLKEWVQSRHRSIHQLIRILDVINQVKDESQDLQRKVGILVLPLFREFIKYLEINRKNSIKILQVAFDIRRIIDDVTSTLQNIELAFKALGYDLESESEIEQFLEELRAGKFDEARIHLIKIMERSKIYLRGNNSEIKQLLQKVLAKQD
ncbi:MAG: hypothetical protein ACFFA1_04760 [Promethearchaeota archaeon]